MPRIVSTLDPIVPCPDCKTIEGRDYSPFLNWLDTEEDLRKLLSWVKVTPCYSCQRIRREKEKRTTQGGRPKKG